MVSNGGARFICAMQVTLVAGALLLSIAADAKRRGKSEPVLSIRTESNASTVDVGDSFQFDIIVTVRTNAPVEELRLPSFKGFTVLRDSRTQRSSVQLRNGRRTVTLEQRYSYVLSADTPGIMTIPAVTARLGTNKGRSRAVKIRVRGAAAAGKSRNGNKTSAAGSKSAGSANGQSNDSLPNDSLPNEKFYLDVGFDKPKVFVGQQATLEIKVYAQQPIDARGLEMPKMPKFWVEQFEATSSRPSERTIRGRRYYVYELHAAALFPLEAGDHVLGPVTLQVSTGSGLWSRGRNYKLKSRSTPLKVLALPKEGRPAGFEPGNVGRWKLVARLKPARTEVGQPVTLVISARGEGNPASIVLPTLPKTVEGLRLFPPTFSEKKDVRNGVLYGSKTAEILVQPLQEGRIRLPELSLRYYDPVRARYDVARTRPLTLHATVAGREASGPARRNGRARIGKGARPVRTGLTLGSTEPFYRSGFFPFLCSLSALLAFALFLWGERRHQSFEGTAGKRGKALSYNRGALEQAIAHGNLRQVQAAVLKHTALIFGEEVRALPQAGLRTFLEEADLDPALAERVAKLLADLEAVLYAPSSDADRARLTQEAQLLLAHMEEVRHVD